RASLVCREMEGGAFLSPATTRVGDRNSPPDGPRAARAVPSPGGTSLRTASGPWRERGPASARWYRLPFSTCRSRETLVRGGRGTWSLDPLLADRSGLREADLRDRRFAIAPSEQGF